MAGIYFHIPFCNTKCNYCDFYSIIKSDTQADLIAAEVLELESRKDYIGKESIHTVYLGGGTPSLLKIDQIEKLLISVRKNFDVSDYCEITLEANPENLTDAYLKGLFSIGINRLSIGIQSFNDKVLSFLGRRHNGAGIKDIVHNAQQIGFDNISGDLIFGVPGGDLEIYTDSLRKLVDLKIQHISAYALTIEKGTLFFKLLNNHKIDEIREEDLLQQFNTTINFLTENGFKHYEISNFAKEGYESRHNSSYWTDNQYIGIGPSAHSYNQISRQWNISSLKKYCDAIVQGKSYFEVETLTTYDKYNEYILTGLRTSNGISKDFIHLNFESKIFKYFENHCKRLIDNHLLDISGNRIILSRDGIFISDYVFRALFFV